MKRIRRDIIGEDENTDDEMDDVLTSFNNQNGLWCIEIAPNEELDNKMKANIMDDYAETIWEYLHFYPQTNSEFFCIYYSHQPDQTHFKPFVVYVLTTIDHINNILRYCDEKQALHRKMFGQDATIHITAPKKATVRDISFFSKN